MGLPSKWRQMRHDAASPSTCCWRLRSHAAPPARLGRPALWYSWAARAHAAHELASQSPRPATAAFPTLIANLALELAPIRVNLIAAGFVDTPLSASLLGDELDKRRDELRATLTIRRVVGPADVAALAVHIMSNTALTGATYDIDGGQQLVS